MAIRQIITAPDPFLKRVSKPVAEVTDDLRVLMDDLLETMYDAPGIGLAAIQVGEPVEAIVLDIARDEDDPYPRYFVNPEITWASEELATYEEGCLSVPEFTADVDRPAEIKLNFLDYDGNKQEIHADGLLATCIQHEIDHLRGILFIDHLSAVKRNIIVRKLVKASKQAAE
ncbi:MAG: peptide deformylase [Alphaproteobacteria bacterium]|nr:MAG: peptide deformylase [Alphaproteobacteria bacterium]